MEHCLEAVAHVAHFHRDYGPASQGLAESGIAVGVIGD